MQVCKLETMCVGRFSVQNNKIIQDILKFFKYDFNFEKKKPSEYLNQIISFLNLFLKYDEEILIQVIKTYILL